MFLGGFSILFEVCTAIIYGEVVSLLPTFTHAQKIKTTKSRTRKLTRDPQHGRSLIIFLLVLFAGKMFQVLSAFCQATPIEEIALDGKCDN